MQENLSRSINSNENSINEQGSFTKTEVGQNYNITKNLNSKKISDPGKYNDN